MPFAASCDRKSGRSEKTPVLTAVKKGIEVQFDARNHFDVPRHVSRQLQQQEFGNLQKKSIESFLKDCVIGLIAEERFQQKAQECMKVTRPGATE